MRHFLVTFHETDGNDCTVYDTYIGADSEDDAYGKVCDGIEAQMQRNGTPYTDDGDFGFYFDCDGECGEECHGHGGIVMRSCEEHSSEAGARGAAANYHCWWESEGSK